MSQDDSKIKNSFQQEDSPPASNPSPEKDSSPASKPSQQEDSPPAQKTFSEQQACLDDDMVVKPDFNVADAAVEISKVFEGASHALYLLSNVLLHLGTETESIGNADDQESLLLGHSWLLELMTERLKEMGHYMEHVEVACKRLQRALDAQAKAERSAVEAQQKAEAHNQAESEQTE